jgi:hypothetical protein
LVLRRFIDKVFEGVLVVVEPIPEVVDFFHMFWIYELVFATPPFGHPSEGGEC